MALLWYNVFGMQGKEALINMICFLHKLIKFLCKLKNGEDLYVLDLTAF